MNVVLERLRKQFGHLLVALLWGHVLIQAVVAQAMGLAALKAGLAAAGVAGA